MELQQFTYITVLFLSVIAPFIMSFESKIRFYKKWIFLVPAILIPGSFFIVWDAIFTYQGIWSFNNLYVLGYYLGGLPLEEWLFFVVIPFCSLFVYEVVGYYIRFKPSESKLRIFLYILASIFMLFAIVNYNLTYTFVTLLLNSIFLIIVLANNNLKNKLSSFFVSYLICSLPMLVVNGVLTSFPVIEYNPLHNSNIRLSTIPIEDFGYYFLLFQMNLVVYEFFKTKATKTSKN